MMPIGKRARREAAPAKSSKQGGGVQGTKGGCSRNKRGCIRGTKRGCSRNTHDEKSLNVCDFLKSKKSNTVQDCPRLSKDSRGRPARLTRPGRPSRIEKTEMVWKTSETISTGKDARIRKDATPKDRALSSYRQNQTTARPI